MEEQVCVSDDMMGTSVYAALINRRPPPLTTWPVSESNAASSDLGAKALGLSVFVRTLNVVVFLLHSVTHTVYAVDSRDQYVLLMWC
jgi:hypothetical protein